MTTTTQPSPVSDERIEARASRLTQAIAKRIRDAMGEMTQSTLAERMGYSSGSTVSDHLNGHTNLTLKTVVRYAVALDTNIVSVPDVKRPKKRRRRRGRKRRVSEQRKALDNIDPVKRKLNTLLVDLSARIGQIIQADADLSQREVARRIDRDEAYVSRVLAGGVNVTLKTIAAFEEALGVCLLSVEGDTEKPSTSYKQSAFVPQVQSSSDGGYCVDQPGVVTQAVNKYVGADERMDDAEELQLAA